MAVCLSFLLVITRTATAWFVAFVEFFAYGVVGSIEWAEKKGGVAHKLAEQAFKIWKLKEKISPDSANWIPRVMQHNSS